MNRNIVIALLLIVLLGVGSWIFFSPQITTDYTKESVKEDTKTPVSSTASKNTFAKILSQDGSYECRYEQATSTGQSINLIYISDGKLRGEFRTTGVGGNMMIYDGINLYAWTEGTKVGTKTQLKSLAELPAIIPQDLTSGSVLGSGLDNVSWDCHPWSKEASFFVLPSEVKFK